MRRRAAPRFEASNGLDEADDGGIWTTQVHRFIQKAILLAGWWLTTQSS